MLYYAAPMEGITTYIYRRAHARFYGGIDKYFTPFIAGKKMTTRETRDVLPENNEGVVLVPQILTNKAGDFLEIARRLAAYGYDTVNLNLGCPSGTVAARKRGAGFLSEPEALDAFLYEIYEKCPLKISVKTRLGISDPDEWDRLLSVYAKYPLQELIIHTRLLQEFYTGATHPEAYALAARRLRAADGEQTWSAGIPLCYNGDILSAESLADVQARVAAFIDDSDSCDRYGRNGRNDENDSRGETDDTFAHPPVIGRVMIGRGLLRNPALATQLRTASLTAADPIAQSQVIPAAAAPSGQSLTVPAAADLTGLSQALPAAADLTEHAQAHSKNTEILRSFHDEILDGYREIMSGDLPVLFKMKDLWTYMIMNFTPSDPSHSPEESGPDRQSVAKYLKKIRKAERIPEYLLAVDTLFRECCVC